MERKRKCLRPLPAVKRLVSQVRCVLEGIGLAFSKSLASLSVMKHVLSDKSADSVTMAVLLSCSLLCLSEEVVLALKN